MVLVDTSVWIDHLSRGNARLAQFLARNEVACHPFVIGELACGSLQNRVEVLALLHALPSFTRAEDGDILYFIERHRLMGRGLGLVDIHLLVSAILEGIALWTLDKKLNRVAEEFALAGY